MTPEQGAFLDGLFKFKVGDVVRHVVGADFDAADSCWPNNVSAQRFIIVERLVQQCPGGIQLHYKLKGGSPEGGVTTNAWDVLEHELVISQPFEKPEVKPRASFKPGDE